MTYKVQKNPDKGDRRLWVVIRSDGFVVSAHRTRAAAEKDAATRNTVASAPTFMGEI